VTKIATAAPPKKPVASADLKAQLGIKSPQEIVPYINLLCYGEPGVGKTLLASTAEDHQDTGPVLHLDIEGGLVTVRKRKNYQAVRVRSIAEIIKIHDSIEQLSAKGECPWRTVVLDNISELQKLDMRTVMEEAKKTARDPDKVDLDVPSQREWGKSGERMRRIIRAFRDLPVHTIAIAWMGSEHDDSTGVVSYYPLLPGKLRGEVPGYFDIVGRLTAVTKNNGAEIVRTMQVTATNRVVAKDRTNSLGGVVENPSIPLIWELINS
jgi:phage nucleotide-binding protein